MKFLFLTLFITVFGFMNYYTYKRFLSKLELFSRYRNLIKYSFLSFYFFVALSISSRYYDIFNQTILYFFSYFIGILFILFVVALAYDLTHTTISKTPFYRQRREFLKITFDVTFLILSFSYILKGIANGLKEPILNKIFIKIKNLKKRDYKIIQLTDVHIGNTIRRDFVEKMVQRTNAQNPDLIVITGDLVDNHIGKILDDVEPLKNLKAKNGVYYVLGNHEYFYTPLATIAHLKTLNIKVLLNQNVVIDDSFNLVGINDNIGKRRGILQPDFKLAFSGIDETLPTIVLAHRPKMVLQMDNYKPDLVISGHTHGGQIFPFGILVLLEQRYLSGLYNHNKHTQIFVSKGTGFWGPPIRILADSEISEIHLMGSS